ncbi:MAG: HEAT repeat domain-containing protein, partial [Planctomycetales bacterium]|nr:HEAT repeat domain-containing protein [Planctomycetales bacterium]
MIKKHLDLNSGRDRGRIYRVVPTNWTATKRQMPGDASSEELVKMLGHSNGWHRDTAARLIVERSQRDAKLKEQFSQLLTKEFETSNEPQAQIRSLYCLRSIDRLSESMLVKALHDEHGQVRRHALKLVETAVYYSEATTSRLRELASDDDILVRYQLALTVGEFDNRVRTETLGALASKDGDYDRMQFAILSSVGADRVEMLEKLPSLSTPLANKLLAHIGRDGTHIAQALYTLEQRPEPVKRNAYAQLLLGTGRRGEELL